MNDFVKRVLVGVTVGVLTTIISNEITHNLPADEILGAITGTMTTFLAATIGKSN
jgi:hypothetical protein